MNWVFAAAAGVFITWGMPDIPNWRRIAMILGVWCIAISAALA